MRKGTGDCDEVITVVIKNGPMSGFGGLTSITEGRVTGDTRGLLVLR